MTLLKFQLTAIINSFARAYKTNLPRGRASLAANDLVLREPADKFENLIIKCLQNLVGAMQFSENFTSSSFRAQPMWLQEQGTVIIQYQLQKMEKGDASGMPAN